MGVELLWVLGYAAVGAAFVALLIVLDSFFLGLTNRFAPRGDESRQRIGTQLPRITNNGPAPD
jgi:hypothetical protein